MENKFAHYSNYFLKDPLSFPLRLLFSIICQLRSWYYSRMIDGGNGKVVFTKPFLKFKLVKNEGSLFYLNGNLKLVPHIEGNTKIAIVLHNNSRLKINGDFTIGNGVKFLLAKNSVLEIGGKDKESDSGITADSVIMAYRKIKIGCDFVCAWNVFISDSDWHSIKGQNHQGDILIGNHVWVANNASVLKGSVINDNCIISGFTKVINKTYSKNSLIAGIPAKVVKEDINWNREISHVFKE